MSIFIQRNMEAHEKLGEKYSECAGDKEIASKTKYIRRSGFFGLVKYSPRNIFIWPAGITVVSTEYQSIQQKGGSVMRATERLEKKIRPIQVIVTEDQYRRLRIRAAMDSTTVSELVRARLVDILDPMAFEDARAMAEQR